MLVKARGMKFAAYKLYANVIDLSERERLGFGVPRERAAYQISHQ